MKLIDADLLSLSNMEILMCNGDYKEALKIVIDKIEHAPDIKLEPLTDREQRIFLAAMSREEKVCKDVDEECRDCREPYDDSLVHICKEITRKVRATLWT